MEPFCKYKTKRWRKRNEEVHSEYTPLVLKWHKKQSKSTKIELSRAESRVVKTCFGPLSTLQQHQSVFGMVCSPFIQILISRQTKFKTGKSNRLKVGQNALANRFFILNDQIPIKWLEGGYETFKVKCKKLFINWNVY